MNNLVAINPIKKAFTKWRSSLPNFATSEFKDELLIFMIVMNIMLILILFNFYLAD